MTGAAMGYAGPLALVAAAMSVGVAGEKLEWTYNTVSADMTGPDDWGKKYPFCAAGQRKQSPINLEHGYWQQVDAPLEFFCKNIANYTLHNIQNQIKGKGRGGECMVDVQGDGGGRFLLDGFHFHSPSEHTLNSKQYDLELHFVHLSVHEPKKISVVGVLFEAKDGMPDHPWLEKVWRHLPSAPLQTSEMSGAYASQQDFAANSIPVNDPLPPLLPSTEHPAYARYMGSLTTPPCSEGVIWNVLLQPQEMSTRQLDMFKAALNYDASHATTARPVQRIFDRVIHAYPHPSVNNDPVPDFDIPITVDTRRLVAANVKTGVRRRNSADGTMGSGIMLFFMAVGILFGVYVVSRRPNGPKEN